MNGHEIKYDRHQPYSWVFDGHYIVDFTMVYGHQQTKKTSVPPT